jgi:predicted RNA methylase
MNQNQDSQNPQEGLQYIHAWHYDMLANQERSEYYNALVRDHCRDKVVLEIGTGSGLIAALAIKHGAKKVICCEENPLLAMAAKQLFRRLGIEDRVTLISKNSNKIATDEIPQVDVVLHELFGSDPFDEHMVPTLTDARRFMKPDAIFLPEKIQILYKPLNNHQLPEKLYFGDIELLEMNALISSVHPNLRVRDLENKKFFSLPEMTMQQLIEKPYSYTEKNPELVGVDAIEVTYLIIHQGKKLQAAEFYPPPGRIHWFPLTFIKLDVHSDKVTFSTKDNNNIQLVVL